MPLIARSTSTEFALSEVEGLSTGSTTKRSEKMRLLHGVYTEHIRFSQCRLRECVRNDNLGEFIRPLLTILLPLLTFLLFLPSVPAFAHPMGNFSINHYSKIEVADNKFKTKYLIDMAEIPTFQELMEIDTDGDKNISSYEKSTYLSKKAEELKKGLSLKLNEKPIELTTDSSDMVFIPGAGGLPTVKINVEYEAKLQKDSLVELNRVFYQDDNYPGRTGWKEVIVIGKGEVSIVDSSAPSRDLSDELSRYPEDTLSSPPQDLGASFSFSLGVRETGVASTGIQDEELNSRTSKVKTPRSSFTELLSKKDLTFEIIVFSLIVAFGFGAFHALSPGHGKTIVAAYLVGSRGTADHALFLGAIVTLTHTIGVFALGLVTLYASRYILPEKLYPWLGFISGLTIVVIGIVLFQKRYLALQRGGFEEHDHGHSHTHSQGYDHHHHHHDNEHEQHHHRHQIPVVSTVELPERVTLGNLFALGVSGGIVPCPEALIVLLSAISLHRIGFGLLLIVAFSIGLAIVLVGIGMMMVYARRFVERFSGDGKIIQRLPLVSSVIISILGFAIAIQSLVSGGIVQIDSGEIIGKIL
ncbi:MAG: nickel/cobalt transporter [Thermodesulfobacteriota bacterium]